MDILFVLLGIALFYAAAAVFAIDHYEVNPAQAAVSFVLPPFAWWLYSHHWARSERIAYTQLVGFVLFASGLAMMTWFSGSESVKLKSEPQKHKALSNVNYVSSSEALADLARAERESSFLNGRMHGENFVFNENSGLAEYDSKGTLRIKHGDGFFGEFEIAIEFAQSPPAKGDWSKTVRPGDASAPSLFVSWFDQEEGRLRVRQFKDNYHLDFALKHEEYNFYVANMQLILPDPENSFMVGEFPVYGSGLRFHGEGLIKDHDSVATLEVIAAQSFTTTYKKNVAEILGFKNTDYDYRSGDGLGFSTAYVIDKKGVTREVDLKFYRNENGWFLDVKGLKDRLKASNNIITQVPARLSQAIKIDYNNIGQFAALNSKQESTAGLDSVSEINQPEAVVATVPVQPSVDPKVPSPALKEVTTKPEKNLEPHIVIDVVTQEAEIESILKPLVNKDVELSTLEGKVKKGVYVGTHRKQIVLELEVGGGMVEFLTEYKNMKSLKVLNSSNTRPQSVDFTSSARP